jgi:ferrochelatase
VNDPMSASANTAVLLIGSGAPGRLTDVRPFLENLVEEHDLAESRLEEIDSHYQAVGGSPYNATVRLQAKALEQELAGRGYELPIYVGMHHWRPAFAEVFELMKVDGIRQALTVLLSPYQRKEANEGYLAALERARVDAGPEAPALVPTEHWSDREGFLHAMVERVSQACSHLDEAQRRGAAWIFTTHSAPLRAVAGTPYQELFRRSVMRVAAELGVGAPVLAYQSRGHDGGPDEDWLEPDVCDALRSAASQGHQLAIVIPIGFLNDQIETLYDLDIEARQAAEAAGIAMIRPKPVGDHPHFVKMLADLIVASLTGKHSSSTHAA